MGCEIPGLNPGTAFHTAVLEDWRGDWNLRCSSEMRRDRKEDQWRRRVSGQFLTLRARRPGEQTGLDTPVVLAVNGARLVWEDSTPSAPELTR